MLTVVTALPLALVRPDTAFSGTSVFRVPKTVLVLALFALFVTGERLVQGCYENAQAKTLAIREVDDRLNGVMANAPAEVRDQARGQALDSILGKSSGVLTAVSIAMSGIGFLFVLIELWIVSTVASQFFGGQEEYKGSRRHSWTLFLVAFIPLALRKLLQGAVMSLRDPDVAANALTLLDYRRLSTVHFDVWSLAGIGRTLPFLTALGGLITDPFFLWTLAILSFGGREVYRISLKGAIALSLVLAVILGLQSALLARIGITWEL